MSEKSPPAPESRQWARLVRDAIVLGLQAIGLLEECADGEPDGWDQLTATAQRGAGRRAREQGYVEPRGLSADTDGAARRRCSREPSMALPETTRMARCWFVAWMCAAVSIVAAGSRRPRR